jgi:holo-[acyl-carrier protein] synthase
VQSDAQGVLANALELLEIAEAERLLAAPGSEPLFSPAERAYAASKSDPARRLAARLAAKRAAARLLGADAMPADVEVLRSPGGPPRLKLAAHLAERLSALGASRALVSLTHGRTHAAALVLLLRE